MTPIGRRHQLEPTEDDEPGNESDPVTDWKRRTIRIDYCQLHDPSIRRQLADLLAG